MSGLNLPPPIDLDLPPPQEPQPRQPNKIPDRSGPPSLGVAGLQEGTKDFQQSQQPEPQPELRPLPFRILEGINQGVGKAIAPLVNTTATVMDRIADPLGKREIQPMTSMFHVDPEAWVKNDPTLKADLESLGKVGRPALQAVGELGGFVGLGPAKAVEALGIPGFKLGQYIIEHAPEAAAFGKLGKALVPNLVANTTGFTLYDAMTTEGGLEQRAVAALHGAASGAAISVLGTAARAAEQRILAGGSVPLEAASEEAIAKNPSLLRKIGAKAVGSALEGTGFAGMDTSWWADMMSGDIDRQARALGVWAGNVAGMVAIKTGDMDGYLHFKQTRPDLNTAALRSARTDEGGPEAAGLAGSPAPTGSPTASTPTPSQSRPAEGPASASDEAKPNAATPSPSPKPTTNLDPLYQAGWEKGPDGEPIYPGSDLTIHDDGSLTAEGVKVAPEHVQQAIQDIALHSIGSRLLGETVFGAQGFDFKETPQGRIAIGEDGRAYAIGLDGNVYSRGLPREPGEEWTNEGPPSMPPDGPLAQQVQRWREFMHTWDHEMAPSAAGDVLHAAIETVARGNPDSQQVQELLRFLSSVQAEGLAQHLTPENLPAVAMEIGRLGAGTNNADAALAQVTRALGAGSTQRGEQPNQEQPKTSSAQPETGDTGSLRPSQDRSGESGAAYVPSGAELASAARKIGRGAKEIAGEVGEAGRHAVGLYHENMPEELRRMTKGTEGEGPASDFARDIERIYSRSRRNQGKLQAPLRELEQMSHGEAAKWLDQVVKDEHGLASTRFNLLMHDPDIEMARQEGAPESAIAATEKVRDIMQKLREQNIEAGNVRYNRKTEKYEPLTPMERIEVLPRMQGEDFSTVMSNPSLRREYAEKVAEGNKVPVEEIEKLFEPFWQDSNQAKRRAALEMSREYHYMPDTLPSHGKEYQVFEGRVVEAAQRMVHNQAARAAVVSVKGPDFADKNARRAYEKDYGETRGPGIEQSLTDLAKVLPNKGTIDFARTLAERVSGINPPLTDSRVAKFLLGAESFRRSAEVFTSPMYDVGDVGVAYGLYGGWKSLAQIIAKAVFKDPRQYVAAAKISAAQAKEAGNVIDQVSHYSEYDLRSAAKKVRDVLTFLGRKSENTKIVIGDLIAQRSIDRMKAGKADSGDAYNAWVLGFRGGEIEQMMTGQGGELYDMYRNQLVAAATGNHLPGEGSYLHQSKTFRLLFPYNTFAMGRMNAFVQNARALISSPYKAVAAGRLLQGAIGLTISGGIQTYLSYLLSGKGTDQFLREVAMAPGWMLLKSALGQGFTGLAGTIGQTAWELAHPGHTAEHGVSQLGSAFLPGRLASEAAALWHNLATGKETVGEAAFRTASDLGVPKPIKVGMNLLGIADSKTQDALRTANRFKHDFEGEPASNDESQRPVFAVAKKAVTDAMKTAMDKGVAVQDDQGVKDAIKQALGVSTGKQIADALTGSKIKFKDEAQAERALRYMGQDQFSLVERYNAALESLAKSYRHEAGTPEPKADFYDRLEKVREAAQYGDPDGLKKLMTEVTDRNAERLRTKLGIDEDLRQTALAITDHPELWDRIFDDRQQMLLAGHRDPLYTITGILKISARDKALAEMNRAKLEARKARGH